MYRSWCHSHGHSVSRPSLAKVTDFLCWLRGSKALSVSSIKGYSSMLSAVFRFHLPSLSSHSVIRDLLRSFCLASAERQLRPPSWDLSGVLHFLNTSEFEPLSRALTRKVLFLLALATAKRVGELQALSSIVTFVGGDACLSYVPQFVAKSESLTRSIPRSFLVKSLSAFAAGLDDDLLLFPVRALRIYLDRTNPLAPLRHRLFVSPRRPSRAISKNAVSSCAMSLPQQGRLDLRWVMLEPMTYVVSPPQSRSTVTGLSPRLWSPPLGAPVRCSHNFIFATFSMNMMAFFLWVRLWLRVRGSGNPHLFLTCSGGRRRFYAALVSTSARLLHLLQWLDAGPAHPVTQV